MRHGTRPARPEGEEEGGPERRSDASARETADYIADLSGELATLARSAQLDLLAYLLDMAELEARGAAGLTPRSARRR